MDELSVIPAIDYLGAVEGLAVGWKAKLEKSGVAPRAGAAAWDIIGILPAHPVITATAAINAADRARAAVYEGIQQLETAGILLPVSTSKRNKAWEVPDLLNLIDTMERGAAVA